MIKTCQILMEKNNQIKLILLKHSKEYNIVKIRNFQTKLNIKKLLLFL